MLNTLYVCILAAMLKTSKGDLPDKQQHTITIRTPVGAKNTKMQNTKKILNTKYKNMHEAVRIFANCWQCTCLNKKVVKL